MSNQKAFSVTLRGELINGAKIGTMKKALGGIDAKLTQFANAAAAQYVISGNKNWLTSLFDLDELRLKNGKLSAKGKQVAAYIKRFSPVSIMEKDVDGIQTVAIQMINQKKNKGLFFTGEKDDNGAPIKIDAQENPEWPLTLREFAELGSQPKAPSTTKTANQLATRTDKLNEAFTDGTVTGSAEELKALADKAQALYNHALSAMAAAAEGSPDVDLEPVAAEMAANTTSSKETRADTDREKHAANA